MIWRLLRALVTVLPVALILAWLFQEKMIFFPHRLEVSPEMLPIPGRVQEKVTFRSSDGLTLHGLWIGRTTTGGVTNGQTVAGQAVGGLASAGTELPPRLTLLFSHGNAGHLWHRWNRLAALSRLPIDVFVYDYRGYGQSAGQPTVAGVVLDGVAALDYLEHIRGIPRNKIILYGESLGTGVATAIYRYIKGGTAGMVLESGFRSLKWRASRKIPLFGSLILRTDLPSSDILSAYQEPLMLIHSQADEVIPIEDTKALSEACPSPYKKILELKSYGHNDPVWEDPVYIQAWEEFLRSLGS